MLTRAVIAAPCKINLTLDITGEDGAGYHLLDSVMLTADLQDLVTLSLRDDGNITVSCNMAGVPSGPENLAAKAAGAFFAYTGIPARGMDIHISKRIPMQAGLAGGSADAAAIIRGLDTLLDTRLGENALREISVATGSDVYFCLVGGCARAQGRGEVLTPQPMPPKCYFVIAKPGSGMSTAEAFRQYDSWVGELPRPDTDAFCKALSEGNLIALGRGMRNIFEGLCAPEEVAGIKGQMLDHGALGAVMTGTGTAVAGLFAREEESRHCRDALTGQYAQVFVCQPLGRGAHVLHAD